MEDIKNIIECLLFVSESPLTVDAIKNVLNTADNRMVTNALDALSEDYETRKCGFFLRQVAGGYQLRTRPEYNEYVKRLIQPPPPRLSKAALETLAIIAYKQPIIRADIEHIRGVDSGGIIRTLMERNLIRVLGRKEIPGRPLIYATTKQFLEVFDLKDLKDLPSPKEIEELTQVNGSDQPEMAPEGPGVSPPAEAQMAESGQSAAPADETKPASEAHVEGPETGSEPPEDMADGTNLPLEPETQTSSEAEEAEGLEPEETGNDISNNIIDDRDMGNMADTLMHHHEDPHASPDENPERPPISEQLDDEDEIHPSPSESLVDSLIEIKAPQIDVSDQRESSEKNAEPASENMDIPVAPISRNNQSWEGAINTPPDTAKNQSSEITDDINNEQTESLKPEGAPDLKASADIADANRSSLESSTGEERTESISEADDIPDVGMEADGSASEDSERTQKPDHPDHMDLTFSRHSTGGQPGMSRRDAEDQEPDP